MNKYPPFIKGLDLNKGFYQDIVVPLLDKKFPGLQYSASLLGYGSDVLGFDTEISMDHNWGPRMQIFVNDNSLIPEIDNCLKMELPFEYKKFPVNFTDPAYDKVQCMSCTDKKPVNHLIEIKTPVSYFSERYSIDKFNNYTNHDWLKFTDQNLLEITSGTVFYDGLNILNNMRQELRFYPFEICKLRMAVMWNYIWNKEAFIGRSMALDDFIGIKIHAPRIIGYLIKILFYLEARYIPYSKWFGTAFKKLKVYNDVKGLIDTTLKENEPKKIETGLCLLYEKIVDENNKNSSLPFIKNRTRDFHNRPYRVIFAENIVEDLVNSIRDEEVKRVDLKEYAHDIILDF